MTALHIGASILALVGVGAVLDYTDFITYKTLTEFRDSTGPRYRLDTTYSDRDLKDIGWCLYTRSEAEFDAELRTTKQRTLTAVPCVR